MDREHASACRSVWTGSSGTRREEVGERALWRSVHGTAHWKWRLGPGLTWLRRFKIRARTSVPRLLLPDAELAMHHDG